MRALLAQKHNLAVPVDDPMLMMVTIQNAFLGAQAQLQKKHEKALAAFMGEQTTSYVKGVEKSVSELSDTLSGVTIKAFRAQPRTSPPASAASRPRCISARPIMAISALLNVAVFVLRAAQNG